MFSALSVQADRPRYPKPSSISESENIRVVGILGTAVDSSHLLSSSVLAKAFSFSSSSRRRAARSAFHAWKAFPAAFRTSPRPRNSTASLASVKASRSLASTYAASDGLGSGLSRTSTDTINTKLCQ